MDSLRISTGVNFEQHWEAIFLNFPTRVDELIGDIVSSDDEAFAHFLVVDTFYPWPASVARKYNILNVSFWTQPTLMFATYYRYDLLIEKGYLLIKGREQGPDLQHKHHKKDRGGSVRAGEACRFHPDQHRARARARVGFRYAPQPANIRSRPFKLHHRCCSSKEPMGEADFPKWLDSKPRGSVVYVSFGSLAQSNRQLAEEIAHGLLLSGVHFVWVIRDGAQVLPDGFEDDSKDQGLIVSWCNQSAVLSNPAVGGFLMHYGWNSNSGSHMVWGSDDLLSVFLRISRATGN
ncbi:hypothetical protein SASPL_111685 [Salvia splendens]|uniref:Uncharacterized protein n=1 Tax=Salvia splendens TaxID=180675 RepID=A0A8X8Y6V5_SALSN|nr:hypothetical protein SASPL_111685 [Salvia splendens]